MNGWDPEDLKEYFLNKEESNCCFVVGNEELYAHSGILGQKCVYFATKLQIDQQKKITRFTWPDVPAKPFKEVLRFLYLDRIEVSDWRADELIPLLKLAKKFRIKKLAEAVMRNLTTESITMDTVGKVFDMASELKMNDLATMAVDYVSQHSGEAFQNEASFKRFSANFLEAILDSNVRIEENDDFLTAMLCWQGYHGADDIRSVFGKIRWRLLSPERLEFFIRWLLEARDGLMDDVGPLSAATSTLSLEIVDEVNLLNYFLIDRVWSSAKGTVENAERILEENDAHRETDVEGVKHTVQIFLRSAVKMNRIRFDLHDTILADVRIITDAGRSEPLSHEYLFPGRVEYSFPTAHVSVIEIAYYERFSVGGLSCYVL